MLKDIRKAIARRRPATRLVQRYAAREAVLSSTDRKPDRRAADIQAAKDWLGCGAPIGDVLTMLEVRHRFDLSHSDCRAYAIEILRAAQGQSRAEAVPTSTPKESTNAAA
jgi:5-methylcytosine-specific restriction endonuclease McrA